MPLGVIGLPVLMPLVALLQLLFPGLLRGQWRQYKIAVHTLLAQSTLICLHWLVAGWLVTQRTWWLGDDVLWQAIVAVSFMGAVYASLRARRQARDPQAVALPPTSIEYIACGTLAAVGLVWMLYLRWTGSSPWDQMSVVTAAALAAVAHLVYRRWRIAGSTAHSAGVTTEAVLLWTLALVGAGLGLYLHGSPSSPIVADQKLHGDWPTFRGNAARTGSAAADDEGPARPTVLWTFDPQERKGRVTFHSSPTVVGSQVFIGAMHEILTLAQGRVYCVSTESRSGPEGAIAAGSLLWRFTAGGTLKPVFSSPSVVAGRVYVGEGYHQDRDCRLLAIDASRPESALWTASTTSHVESSPAIADGRAYFGGGDDGILCVELKDGRAAWQFGQTHVDASPLVADGLVFAGSVIGDRYQSTEALALDAGTGKLRWRVPAPMPLPGAPAYAEDRVFFTLGNDKFDHDADAPAGGLWCLDAQTGRQQWEFASANSVLGSPALLGEHVYICSRDQHCYCLEQSSGKLIWKRDLWGPIVASPIAAGGRIYALTTSAQLWCLSAGSGDVLWRFDELSAGDDDAYSSPTLAAGRLYVAVSGKLYCLGDATSP